MIFTFSRRHIAISVFTFITVIVIVSIAVFMLALCSGVFAFFVFLIVFAEGTVAGEVEVFPFFDL